MLPAHYLPLLKAALIYTPLSILLSMIQYRMRARWSGNPIGRAIMQERISLLIMLSLSFIAVFFQLSARTSEAVAWLNLAGLVYIGIVHNVLTWIFERIHREEVRKISAKAGLPATGRHRRRDGLIRRNKRKVMDRG